MLENLVCSLEMGKKLKSAGWNQPTEFVYEGNRIRPWPIDYDSEKGSITPSFDEILERGFVFYPAPTAEEILRELPPAVQQKYSGWFDLGVKRCRNGEYMPWCALMHGHGITYKKMSEASAQMWLWCKENNHIADSGKKGDE